MNPTYPAPAQVARILGCNYDARATRHRRGARTAAHRAVMTQLDQARAHRAALAVALDERWLDDVRAESGASAR